MGKSFASVGAALPPRRDMIAAADTPAPSSGFGHSIIVPEARDRLLELFQREQLPQDVRYTLDGSLMGDLHRQQLLFQAMIDTWPRLQKALREVQLKVRNAPWKAVPWARRGEKPTKEAETLANEVENSVWSMKPVMRDGLKGFEGTVEEIAMGYWLGHYVGEIHWHRDEGMWQPKCTRTLPPRFYGYPSWDEGADRLMFDKSGGKEGVLDLKDFPDHRFLTAVHGGHPGHPTIAAPLRALTGYWLGAVYGLKWLMQFAQLFGIPFRWAEYATGDPAAKAEVVDMMRRIGSEGWAAFPAGTKMQFLDSSKGGSSLVQRELLDLADEQCDIFILGQNLTSDSGDKGARALGEVHMEVRDDIVKGVSDFVGEVLTHQFAPSIVALNYGDSRKDVPGIWAVFEEPKDEKGLAERDNALGITTGKIPVGKAWFYERHNIPMPGAGEEIFEPTPDPEPTEIGPDGKPLPPKPGQKKPVPEKNEKVAAGLRDDMSVEVDDPSVKALLKRMEQAMKKGSLVDADAIADLLGAAWINAAKVTAGYDPTQPRDPKGSETGGRWTTGNPSHKNTPVKSVSLADIDNGAEIPEGWYVHGRNSDKSFGKTGVAMATRDIETAYQYAGKKGSIIAIKEGSMMNLPEKLPAIQADILAAHENGELDPETDAIISTAKEAGDIESIILPPNLVDDAGLWDTSGFTGWFWDKYGVDGVIIRKGEAVFLDASTSKHLNLSAGETIPGD